MEHSLSFSCDYMEGAHPQILQRLMETNLEKTPGYGSDCYCEAAKAKIREACKAPAAEIFFLVGGTQTNATVIDAMLKSYQGVIAASTGHISVHEVGAIEFGGHKVLTLPHHNGKISASQIEALLEQYQNDASHDHMVMPGMVYLSHPTEYGTLYSREELTAISSLCRAHQIPLYLDGARLAYALACPQNDLTLADLAALCDVFYIGGTKCGALFGEAVVIPNAETIPHFFTIIKQHGALRAKGRLLASSSTRCLQIICMRRLACLPFRPLTASGRSYPKTAISSASIPRRIRSSVSLKMPQRSGRQGRWNSASGKRMMIPIRSSALPQAGQPGRRTRRHCRTS